VKNLESWSRLAAAAADARDDLRALLPRLDRTIEAGQDQTGLLREVRILAAKHADRLRLALKSPGRPKTRRNGDSWRTGGLWEALR
jgi:hypothetical protein